MRDCQEVLLGRVRRGLASAQERAAFDAHCNTCDSCRLTFDVMGDFDAAGEVRPGDSDLVARIAAAAARTHGVPPSVRRRGTPRRLAVAALVFASTAAASGLGIVAFRSRSQHLDTPRELARPQAAAARTSPPVVVDLEPSASAEEELDRPTPAVRGVQGRASGAPSPLGASEMYRSANDARREGKASDAIRGYRELQRRFPGSMEARAARVSLGGLLLRGGSSSDALAQFDAYLESGGGQLAAEALFGRGRALQALGRAAEEFANWERLLRQYPNSAYATHAKRRLDERH